MTPIEENLLEKSCDLVSYGEGCGVELRGSAMWQAARRLVAREMGWIEGGAPQGSSLPGLFFANTLGVEWFTGEPVA